MSRILGPEFGGSIGIIFAIANAINASLNIVGFVQTVQDAMWNYGGYIIVDGDLNDTRILGTILLIFVWALCGAGAKYEAKVFHFYHLISISQLLLNLLILQTQSFLLLILLVATTLTSTQTQHRPATAGVLLHLLCQQGE
jgi:amino acid transporter